MNGELRDMRRPTCTARGSALLSAALGLSACASLGPDRDHDAAAVNAPVASLPTPASSAGSDAISEFRGWQQKWQQVQSNPDSVPLKDHWTICELQYRFRIYGDLFRCVELLDQRVSRQGGDAARRNYTLVLTGWMRATAYTELGQLPQARLWLDTAWDALPEDLRNVAQEVDPERLRGQHKELEEVFTEAGADPQWGNKYEPLYRGSNNLARLDLRPEAIAMSLAAQRSIVHEQLGEAQVAQAALQELNQWRVAKQKYGILALRSTTHPYEFDARQLSIGPYYALHDDAMVIQLYEKAAKERRALKFGRGHRTSLGDGAALVVRAFERVLLDVRRFDQRVEDASDDLLYASSLAHVGRTKQAKEVLDRLINDRETQQMGSVYWSALYQRSQIAVLEGQPKEAIALMQNALDAIERVRSTITLEAAKIGFAADKQAVYAALVRALVRGGDWSGAFVVIERAKARALVDMLAQNHDLPPPPDASERVRALLAQATATISDLPLPAPEDVVATRNLSVEARAELATAAPQAASLISVPRIRLQDVGAKLATDETLLDYFVAGADLYVTIVTRDGVSGQVLRAEGLAEEVRGFRGAIAARSADTGRYERSLYDRLVRPLAGALRGGKLTIAPNGPLHYLPWAALSDGREQLIDQFALRIEPSASALVYLRGGASRAPGRLLAFGNPDLGDPRFDLPGAEREARSIAAMFSPSRALLRRDASKSAVKSLAGGFTMLHFASHGVFDPSAPLNSGLLLARGTESDGRLTVADLYTLHLNATLVTLSACETGLGDIESGDDVIGLTRGFLYAGAQTIIASLWSVQDDATANLMTALYAKLNQMDKRAALREAQLKIRAVHPDPLYWAAFEMTGSAD
jgi:CHAT domain-containing protein